MSYSEHVESTPEMREQACATFGHMMSPDIRVTDAGPLMILRCDRCGKEV